MSRGGGREIIFLITRMFCLNEQFSELMETGLEVYKKMDKTEVERIKNSGKS